MTPHRTLLAILAVLIVLGVGWLHAQDEKAPKRVPWTLSKITGTPEPPHPYIAERVFPKLDFKEPVFLVRAPGVDRWFVGEREGRILSFRKTPDVAKADLVCDLTKEIKSWTDPNIRGVDNVYSLVFHPQFAKNRFCYVCYTLASKKGEQLPEGSRISRFRLTDADPPTLDVASEQVVITWLGGGHNGCDLHFGNDGMLYFSTGDGSNPNPPDRLDTGQDCSDLLSSILRIDVDRPDAGRNYGIPKDNPFVALPKVRGEIWAFGFRNPWRMSFDRPTGDLWVGDVGWELWETVDRVRKGGNYGWSVREGRQDVRPASKIGPSPILTPTIEFPHTEAASITGGFVYHGKKFPELEGAYICGDWVSRKVWATKFAGEKMLWHKEIAQTNARIVAFGEDTDGELVIVEHNTPGRLYALSLNPATKTWKDTFPRKLSETGLFASTKDHTPAAGVQPYDINVEPWMDGATARRFVAFPGLEKAKLYDEFQRYEEQFWGSHSLPPKDGVFVKTISMEMEIGNPESTRRLETQILHFDGSQWRGYSYCWNADQTDADLVSAGGKDTPLIRLNDPRVVGGTRRQTWHTASRAECMTCHNPWAGFALSFTPQQLAFTAAQEAGEFAPHDRRRSQLADLVDGGWVDLLHKSGGKETSLSVAKLSKEHRLTAIQSPNTEQAARSYLQANCAHCHQFGAGGAVDLELRLQTPLAKAKIVDVAPIQGAFDLAGAKIVAPGDPYRSTLYYRMSKLGRGRMPHIGSDVVDPMGLALVGKWIREMPTSPDAAESLRKLFALEGKKEKSDDAERTRLVNDLLKTTSSALMLADAVDFGDTKSLAFQQSVRLGLAHPNPLVRDLFERFSDQRVERLGTVDAETLLALGGDAGRGRDLFFSQSFQCGACHRVEKKGGQFGPDLSDVAKRLSKAQIVESLLTPSKTIEEKYRTTAIETQDGRVQTGLVVEKTATHLVMRVAGDKELRVPLAEIVSTITQPVSLMPDNLLRDATRAQAGDLLAYLWSLR